MADFISQYNSGEDFENYINSLATASSVADIVSGTTKVGNTDKFDGQDSTYFASQASVNASLLTKINISDIIDNLTSTDTNKPVSANQAKALKYYIDNIVISGTTANGTYTKFSDGTMICRMYVASQTTDSTGNTTWTFPTAFKTGEIPIVTVSPVATLSASQNAVIGTTPTATSVVLKHTMSGAAINAQAVRYCATATGFWK